MTYSTQGVDSISPKNDQIKGDVQPSGIRWVAIYSSLIAIGFGQYGLALLIKSSNPESIFVGGLLTILTFSFVAAIYGLLTWKFWGYKLAKVLYVVLLGIEILKLVLDLSIINILAQGLVIGLTAWILLYLWKDKVKVWFNDNV